MKGGWAGPASAHSERMYGGGENESASVQTSRHDLAEFKVRTLTRVGDQQAVCRYVKTRRPRLSERSNRAVSQPPLPVAARLPLTMVRFTLHTGHSGEWAVGQWLTVPRSKSSHSIRGPIFRPAKPDNAHGPCRIGRKPDTAPAFLAVASVHCLPMRSYSSQKGIR